MVERSRRRIPDATVARLPVYLRLLYEVAADGATNVSSERLAELAGVNAAKVRKDLSYLGSYGTRGVGYEVEFLVDRITAELGLTADWPVAIVGLGNLGQALANYRGFGARGFPMAAWSHRPGQGGHRGFGHVVPPEASPTRAGQGRHDRRIPPRGAAQERPTASCGPV
jgi:hypothetical protein